MLRGTPTSRRTDTLVPYAPLFRPTGAARARLAFDALGRRLADRTYRRGRPRARPARRFCPDARDRRRIDGAVRRAPSRRAQATAPARHQRHGDDTCARSPQARSTRLAAGRLAVRCPGGDATAPLPTVGT